MTVIDQIEKRLAEARRLLADAVARLSGAKGLADAKAAAVDRLAAEAVIENLSKELIEAESASELDRLKAARAKRIEAAGEAQKAKLDAAQKVKAELATRLVEAITATHDTLDALAVAGLRLDLKLPVERNGLTYLRDEVLSRAKVIEAEASRSAEMVEADAESKAWAVVRQAHTHATAKGKGLPPHQVRLWLRDADALAGGVENFIREGIEWRGNGDDEACDRALFLALVEGWTLDPADEIDIEGIAA